MKSFTKRICFILEGMSIELDVYYTPGSPSSYDYPGDAPEVEPGSFVEYSDNDYVEVTTWRNFVLTYAAAHAASWRLSGKLDTAGVSVVAYAEDLLQQKMIESVEQELADSEDCAREDTGWRDE